MSGKIPLLLLLLTGVHPLQSQITTLHDAAEIKLALKKLTVLGSVLYIAAHPDDENTAFLAAMAKGRCERTAYLSCTRGEGGQNLVGPEQGDLLGLIRTQELLAARRVDGAEQYFTRAIDFGFSKTADETLRMWGKERTLADMVWVIRNFRPDVIVTRFTPNLGGHGNHTASAILAEEAFRAAADPAQFPDQLQHIKPWQATRLVWNVFRFSATDTAGQIPGTVTVDLGEYSPLLGKSFTEIAGEGRSMHKSQGFGAAQSRGEFRNSFQHLLGDSALNDLFDGVNTTWSRVPGADSIGTLLEEAYQSFDIMNPAKSIPVLLKALSRLEGRSQDPWIILKKKELANVIAACAGLWIDATTPEGSVVPGGEVKFELFAANRSSFPFMLERVTLPFEGTDTLMRTPLQSNRPVRQSFSLTIPPKAQISQPYWLSEPHGTGSYTISDPTYVGRAEDDPPVMIRIVLASPDEKLTFSIPLCQRLVDPVDGELRRPLNIVPPVVSNIEEPVVLFPDTNAHPLAVTLKSTVANARGTVRLILPRGWRASPEYQKFNLRTNGDEITAIFSVQPANGAASGTFVAQARVGSTTIERGKQTARYTHIPPQTFFPRAEGKLLRIDLKKRGQRVGYIMGAGDEIPRAIRQMGYSVTLLSDTDLAEGQLDAYDVIVAGIRANNTRPALRMHQSRLMEYVKHGGTYIVQYVTPQRGEPENLGPYPFAVSRDRVAEEDAPVSIVRPDDPLVTIPNRITGRDFDGWVQERGLYFADRWDAKYDTVLVCHDRNEPGRAGGLLEARYGNGYYVYCAYAFFRQLPAGVEGAYRLFANILSLQTKRHDNHFPSGPPGGAKGRQ